MYCGDAAAGTGGGMPNISLDHIALFMKLVGYAKLLPGFLVGFSLTLAYMLLWVGPRGFQQTIAPIAGYHLIVFFALKELLAAWRLGQSRWRQRRVRQMAQRSFVGDIAMQYQVQLD